MRRRRQRSRCAARRAEIVSPSENAATAMVTVPLRGCRRALGTIVSRGWRSKQAARSTCWIEPTSSARSCRARSRTCSSSRSRAFAAGAGEHLRFDLPSRRRLGYARHHRPRQPGFATRIGRTREDLLNQPLADHLGPELGRWLERHKAAKTPTHSDSADTIEVVDPMLKGPFVVTVTDLLNHDRESVGSVIVARDLTPQTLLEAEREELRKRLTQSEKLAALGSSSPASLTS
jgi:hypothetical protein